MKVENTHFENDNSKTITTRNLKSSPRSFNSSAGVGIFGIIICILFVIAFSRVLNDSSPVTFTAFLEWISSFSPLFPDLTFVNYGFHNDWGLLNALRDFFNIFANVISVVVYLFKSIINLLSYLIGIVRFLFV